MSTEEPDDWRRRSAERAVRITVGVEKVSQEWQSYLALVIAAPDHETLRRWTCERFGVDDDVAAAVLDQQLKTLIARRGEGSTERQLTAIANLLAIADGLDAPVWLRGGWAMDFCLGRVTRKHLDIDWFALVEDGPRLRDCLVDHGFEDVTSTEPGQQFDVVRDGVDHGIALIRLDDHGEPLVAGGPWAGEPWPAGMLKGVQGRIGDLVAPVIAPAAQIEIKQMMPIWNPCLPRRQKDIDDIAAIRTALN